MLLMADVFSQEGTVVGVVGEVKEGTKEIIIQTAKSAQVVAMGDSLYVRIGGKVAVMKAVSPMQTVAKCVLEGAYGGYFGKLAKGMTVYRYREGIENEKSQDILKTTPHAPGDLKDKGGIEPVASTASVGDKVALVALLRRR